MYIVTVKLQEGTSIFYQSPLLTIINHYKPWLNHNYLVGGFNPSEKYESQWEELSHILWKVTHVPNRQPDYVYTIQTHLVSIPCITWHKTHLLKATLMHVQMPCLLPQPKRYDWKLARNLNLELYPLVI
jgi:hypothetical protein